MTADAVEAKIAQERRLGIFMEITPTEHQIHCARVDNLLDLAERWEDTARRWEDVANLWEQDAVQWERFGDLLWRALCVAVPVTFVVGVLLGYWGRS